MNDPETPRDAQTGRDEMLEQTPAIAAPTTARAGAAEQRERVELLLALALLHSEHGQPRRALTYAMLAQTFAPADPLTRRMLAFALLRNDAAAEALETLAPLLDAAKPQPEVDRLHAAALDALGRPQAARDAFWRAIGARPEPAPRAAAAVDAPRRARA